MPFARIPRPKSLKSLTDAKLVPFWLEDKDRPQPASTLTGSISADLCVIGAGFSGLWSALLARESDPGLDVVLLEATGWIRQARRQTQPLAMPIGCLRVG